MSIFSDGAHLIGKTYSMSFQGGLSNISLDEVRRHTRISIVLLFPYIPQKACVKSWYK